MEDLAYLTKDQPTPRKGLMGRFRSGKKNKENQSPRDNRDQTPSPPLDADRAHRDRHDYAIADEREAYDRQDHGKRQTPATYPQPLPELRMSALENRVKRGQKNLGQHYVELMKPPTARDAAFAGPPRYDWIDIETAAAIKVQSVFRRNKVMTDLEQSGRTTAAIRNRSRRREARKGGILASAGADVPSIFACCGVGFAFGDATEDDLEATRAYQKAQYQEKKKAQLEREAKLRDNFRKMQLKKKSKSGFEESYEVVE